MTFLTSLLLSIIATRGGYIKAATVWSAPEVLLGEPLVHEITGLILEQRGKCPFSQAVAQHSAELVAPGSSCSEWQQCLRALSLPDVSNAMAELS